jgi:hypothetical protein
LIMFLPSPSPSSSSSSSSCSKLQWVAGQMEADIFERDDQVKKKKKKKKARLQPTPHRPHAF